jgi:hypothetical protein
MASELTRPLVSLTVNPAGPNYFKPQQHSGHLIPAVRTHNST